MTIDHPVRRVLARVCSTDTMARVVDPILADMGVERGRPAWFGYLSLARALALYAIVSAPGAMARVWTDDDRAVPRAVMACMVTALVLTAPLVGAPAKEASRLSWRAVWLLVPQALAIALPPSLLVAIPLAFRSATHTRRLLLRGLAMSLVCAVATTVVITRLVPDANQGFRIEVAKRVGAEYVHLEPGPVEMTQTELRERIDVLRLTPGGERVARRLEYTYHLKLALGMIAVPLGAFAVAIAMSQRGRARPLLIGVLSLVAYIVVIFPFASAAERLSVRLVAVPAAVFAWTPAVVLLVFAAIALHGSAQRRETVV